MLASQLCEFDDTTDSKLKHSMVVLSEIVKISICDMVVAQFSDLFNNYDTYVKVMCHVLTQGIRTIETSIKYKKCYCG